MQNREASYLFQTEYLIFFSWGRRRSKKIHLPSGWTWQKNGEHPDCDCQKYWLA